MSPRSCHQTVSGCCAGLLSGLLGGDESLILENRRLLASALMDAGVQPVGSRRKSRTKSTNSKLKSRCLCLVGALLMLVLAFSSCEAWLLTIRSLLLHSLQRHWKHTKLGDTPLPPDAKTKRIFWEDLLLALWHHLRLVAWRGRLVGLHQQRFLRPPVPSDPRQTTTFVNVLE